MLPWKHGHTMTAVCLQSTLQDYFLPVPKQWHTGTMHMGMASYNALALMLFYRNVPRHMHPTKWGPCDALHCGQWQLYKLPVHRFKLKTLLKKS